MDIEKLFGTLLETIPQMGYSPQSCESKFAALYRIKRHICSAKSDADVASVLDAYEMDLQRKFLDSRLSPYAYQNDSKAMRLIREYLESGKITYPIKLYDRYRKPNDYYQSILADYEVIHAKTHTPASTSSARASIRDFIFFLEDRNINNISSLTTTDVSDYILHLADKYNSSIVMPLTRIRTFFRWLISQGLIDPKLLVCLSVRSAKRTKLRGFFGKDEISKIIAASDEHSMYGKRNYAILLLAKYTGLRGIDIRHMKRENIDWENKTVSLIQSKTCKPIVLPLENNVGNAVADYLLNWRPQNDSPFLFLTTKAPFQQLSKGALTSIVKRCAAKAGLYWNPEEFKGIYSFRHSMGTHLLTSDVSVDMIAEVLGHSSPRATKPYLSVDIEHLKLCAMPIDYYETTSAEVML